MDWTRIQHKTPFNTSLWTGQNGQEGVVVVRESDGDVIFLLDLFRYETGGGGGLLVSINLKININLVIFLFLKSSFLFLTHINSYTFPSCLIHRDLLTSND